ncbi:uncharacterized protein B0T23DRAFT_404070 [Neurospora hispaniola]|uniref:Uncharacterized protein n=1 Tax=Neurospora hispaniola TaxID=588809 RepID=A0AAJ0IBL6_9PEZI|nr:hypothetical protein B0T23DRAFT_404070 [Neurospora hispaniola]
MEPNIPSHDDPKSKYPAQAQAVDLWSLGNGDEMDIDLIDPALDDLYPFDNPNPDDPNPSPSLPPPPPSAPPATQPLQPPQDQPRIPLEVMQRIEANIARVQAALNAMGAAQSQHQNQDAPKNAPSTPPNNRSVGPKTPVEGEQGSKNKVQSSSVVDFDGLLESLKKTLDNLPDDDTDDTCSLTLPRPRPNDMLTVHDLFTLLRAAPPKVGCVIPNSERQIWYRPTQADYVELNQAGSVADIVHNYLLKPSYLTTYLSDACGWMLWFMYDKTQWCTCRYDPVNTRFVRGDEPPGGNGSGALVVGYRTPWAPICNGCRGDISVEVRVLDYLARWFSFPVPEGSNILDVIEARVQAERFQQADVAGPWTPNGPPPEPEGRAEIELSANSKALSRKFQSLLQGFSGGALDEANAARKPKRRRYEEEDETGESNKRQRVEEKRHRLPDGSFLYDPFVDDTSADVPLSGGDPFGGTGDAMMLDNDDDDWPSVAAAPPPPNSPNAPHVATANNQTNNNPQPPQRPQQLQRSQRSRRPRVANPEGIPPRATAADAHARLAAEGKEYPPWPVDLLPGQHCNNCKSVRMKPAKENTRKCQKCIDTHAKIREINRERGYCTNMGCKQHQGIPRPLKENGEPFAYCPQCREKSNQKHAAKLKKAKKGQDGGGGGGSEQGGGQAQAA